MPSPFPGMDPYLEGPDLWSDFHAEMISAIRAQLAPAVQPRYLVYIGERVYVTYEREEPLRRMRPDVAVERGPDTVVERQSGESTTNRPNCAVYPFSIRKPLGRIPIPLAPEDTDVVLDLQTAFETTFSRGPYAHKIDYAQEPQLPLTPELSRWARTLLRKAGVG